LTLADLPVQLPPGMPPLPAGMPLTVVADKIARFRSKLCIFFLNSGGRHCPYGDRCMYAHGDEQLRLSAAAAARLQDEVARREAEGAALAAAAAAGGGGRGRSRPLGPSSAEAAAAAMARAAAAGVRTSLGVSSGVAGPADPRRVHAGHTKLCHQWLQSDGTFCAGGDACPFAHTPIIVTEHGPVRVPPPPGVSASGGSDGGMGGPTVPASHPLPPLPPAGSPAGARRERPQVSITVPPPPSQLRMPPARSPAQAVTPPGTFGSGPGLSPAGSIHVSPLSAVAPPQGAAWSSTPPPPARAAVVSAPVGVGEHAVHSTRGGGLLLPSPTGGNASARGNEGTLIATLVSPSMYPRFGLPESANSMDVRRAAAAAAAAAAGTSVAPHVAAARAPGMLRSDSGTSDAGCDDGGGGGGVLDTVGPLPALDTLAAAGGFGARLRRAQSERGRTLLGGASASATTPPPPPPMSAAFGAFDASVVQPAAAAAARMYGGGDGGLPYGASMGGIIGGGSSTSPAAPQAPGTPLRDYTPPSAHTPGSLGTPGSVLFPQRAGAGTTPKSLPPGLPLPMRSPYTLMPDGGGAVGMAAALTPPGSASPASLHSATALPLGSGSNGGATSGAAAFPGGIAVHGGGRRASVGAMFNFNLGATSTVYGGGGGGGGGLGGSPSVEMPHIPGLSLGGGGGMAGVPPRTSSRRGSGSGGGGSGPGGGPGSVSLSVRSGSGTSPFSLSQHTSDTPGTARLGISPHMLGGGGLVGSGSSLAAGSGGGGSLGVVGSGMGMSTSGGSPTSAGSVHAPAPGGALDGHRAAVRSLDILRSGQSLAEAGALPEGAYAPPPDHTVWEAAASRAAAATIRGDADGLDLLPAGARPMSLPARIPSLMLGNPYGGGGGGGGGMP